MGVEPTVAVVPTSPEKRNYVVAFIGDGASWAVSTDQGSTWQRHNDSEPGFAWGPPAEMPGDWHYGTDPTLVTTGHPNQVAFVTIADGRQVAIALSTDGGVHFGNVHLVSSPEDRNFDPEPTATVNSRTGQIWVAWTDTQRGKLMLRGLHYDVNGVLTFDTPPMDISGLPGLGQGRRGDVNATLAAGDFKGTSHVAIAYADRYDPFEGGPSCPGTLDLHYWIADSTDSGKTWQAVQIVHDTKWPQCVTDDPNEGYNRNRPAIAFAGGLGLNYYVALTQSSRTGSLVHLYRVSWPFNQTSVHDFGTVPPPDEKPHDQFFPAIAVGYTTADVSSSDWTTINVMVTWHDTREDPQGANHLQLVYGSVSGLGSWTGIMSPAQGMANEHVPWAFQDFWGDYEALAADNASHAFIAAWTDNRFDGFPQIWTCVLRPLNP